MFPFAPTNTNIVPPTGGYVFGIGPLPFGTVSVKVVACAVVHTRNRSDAVKKAKIALTLNKKLVPKTAAQLPLEGLKIPNIITPFTCYIYA